MEVIGVTGFAQHGKDSIAQVLVEHYGFTRIGLADAVREAALAINPIVLTGPATFSRLAEVVAERGWDVAKQLPEVRRLLQVIGTEAGRKFHDEDIWVRKLAADADRQRIDRLVVPDVRFPNEAAFVRGKSDLGRGYVERGALIRVTRPGFDNKLGSNAGHDSERHIKDLPVDELVLNDGTLRGLTARVDLCMESLGYDVPNPIQEVFS